MNKKRVLSLVLSFVLILQSFSLAASATSTNSSKIINVNGINVNILQDDDCFKTTRSSDNNGIYEWNLNKKTHELIYRKFDPITKNLIEKKCIAPAQNKIKRYSFNEAVPNSNIKSKSRITRNENTLVNYEYDIYGLDDHWQIRRPDTPYLSFYYFDTYETADNISQLKDFKNIVDKINGLESQLVYDLGGAGLSLWADVAAGVGTIFSGGTATPAMIAALAVTVGATGKAQNTLNDLII